MYLYHYYDKDFGPFKNLSDVSNEEVKDIVNKIAREKQSAFCNKRNPEYMLKRRYYENILREEFSKKGGRIERNAPQYMVIGECDFLNSWYVNSAYVKIDIDDFDKNTLSFTYGDSHPTFSDLVNDGKEYRKKLYTYDEILEVIEKYGYPQDWNKSGEYGPERYIEVHVWSDETLKKYYLQILDKENIIVIEDRLEENQTLFSDRPTEQDYAGTIDEFWWVLKSFAEYILREELLSAMFYLNMPVRDLLNKMIKWHIFLENGKPVDMGILDSNMEQLLDVEYFSLYKKTYPTGECESLWIAYSAVTELFGKIGRLVADKCDYAYPANKENDMLKLISEIREIKGTVH